MQELEKILEEINRLSENHINKAFELVKKEPLTQRYTETDIEQTKAHELAVVKDIIRKHMNDGWIPVEERLPENERYKGRFCQRYQVDTICGITEGWYNPDVESWYCLIWFKYGTYKTNDIDFERGSLPKVVRMPVDSGFVRAWKQFPERYIPETQNAKKKYEPEWKRNFRKKFERRI